MSYFIIDNSKKVSANKIIVFGDSLSDIGYQNNIYNVFIGWPKIPDSNTVKQPTFTSPVLGKSIWVEFLVYDYDKNYKIKTNNINTPSPNIGLSVNPSINGHDYAAGGAATTCVGIGLSQRGKQLYTPPPIGITRPNIYCKNKNIDKYSQVGSYLKNNNGVADPNIIYIIWGGANNIFIYEKNSEMQAAAQDIVYNADILVKKGAKASNIYILNLPKLGITPLAKKENKVSLFNSLSETFNKELLIKFKNTNYNLINVNNNFFKKIVDNQKITIDNKIYTFSNTSEGLCKDLNINSLRCIPDYSKKDWGTYLFEDDIHITSYGHYVLAKFIKEEIDSTRI